MQAPDDPRFPLLYDELRRIARQKLEQLPAGQTLQATALVHEAWLRLAETDGEPSSERFQDREHLRCATAQAMRWILVDHARRRTAKKRPNNRADVDPESLSAPADDGDPEGSVVRLDRALAELERQDPRRGRVVLLRYFAGLSVEETAAAMELSPATVKRDWQFARAWLLRAMAGEDPFATAPAGDPEKP
ncbi:MAG: ECF-type sigma factor [bacterium]|nr:ECF-type sigma factor [bacterium]